MIYKNYGVESFTRYMCIFCPTKTDLFLNITFSILILICYYFTLPPPLWFKGQSEYKNRKQDVIAFVNTVTQFIHRGSYAHIVTVVRKFS